MDTAPCMSRVPRGSGSVLGRALPRRQGSFASQSARWPRALPTSPHSPLHCTKKRRKAIAASLHPTCGCEHTPAIAASGSEATNCRALAVQ
eukprot:4742672-Pyramimonas_sp.AAC.1